MLPSSPGTRGARRATARASVHVLPPRLPLLLLLLIVAACGGAAAEPPAEAGGPERLPVRVAPVEAAAAAGHLVEATGTLAAAEETPLGFAVGGVVARLVVTEGDAVRAGQTLATLDRREVEARLAQARAAAAKAERDLERTRALHRDSVASLAQLQDATTAAEVARAAVAQAGFAVRYATITAPGDGRVLRRLAEPGQVVGAGAPVLVVGNRAAGTVLRVGLPDRDALRVRPGDAAEVTFGALPDRVFAGRVREVGAAASPGVGTYPVEIALEDARALPSGLVGRVRIRAAAADDARLVPVSALVEADGDRATVYLIEAEPAEGAASGTPGADASVDAPVPSPAGGTLARVRRATVRLGALQGNRVVVRGGLPGDGAPLAVVTDGAAFLDDGARVRIVP